MLLEEFAMARSVIPLLRKLADATAIADGFTVVSLRCINTPVVDLVTGKRTGKEATAPGLVTVIDAVDAVAMSVAKICAVTCVPLTTVVFRGLPFHFTTAPAAKPVPFTVRVKAAPPGAVAVGTSGWFTRGVGFSART